MVASPYDKLLQLMGFQVPVYVSQGVEEPARRLAARFEQAYQFLTTRLDLPLEVQLAFLSPQDWARYTEIPYYGVTFYDYPRRTVVTGAAPTTFWRPLLELVHSQAALFQRLQATYGGASGEIDLTPHVELWMIHDLGHACHLHPNYWFPRKWLMEFFATLCLYSYIAANEPDQLAITVDFLVVMHELPAHRFAHRTLQAFDSLYTSMPLENYLWYSGHFMQQARELYARMELEALRYIWQRFVLEDIRDVSDNELERILKEGPPDIAQVLLTQP